MGGRQPHFSGRGAVGNLRVTHIQASTQIYTPIPFAGIGCPAAESEKVFAKREALKSHINTHVDDYPFECPTGGAKVKRRPDLNKHGRTYVSVI